jgi:hypothetical protein
VRQARLFRADANSIGGWPGAAAFETRQAAMLPEAENAGCSDAKFTERRLGAGLAMPLNNWGRTLSELSFTRRSAHARACNAFGTIAAQIFSSFVIRPHLRPALHAYSHIVGPLPYGK